MKALVQSSLQKEQFETLIILLECLPINNSTRNDFNYGANFKTGQNSSETLKGILLENWKFFGAAIFGTFPEKQIYIAQFQYNLKL